MIGTYVGVSATANGPWSVIALKDSPITPDTPTPLLYVLKTAMPGGINEGDFVYFENPSGNLAANVRAASKTVIRSPQGFEIDTWS
jgi:hypothetical protein